MLIGEYKNTIDDKSRVSLPAKFRKELGKKIVVTPGLEECLFIFTLAEWMKVTKRLSSSEGELSFLKSDRRDFNRYMFGRATEVEVDSVGRILLPEFLKDRAKLKGNAVFVGVEDRVEIWNEKLWNSYRDKVEKNLSGLAERI